MIRLPRDEAIEVIKDIQRAQFENTSKDTLIDIILDIGNGDLHKMNDADLNKLLGILSSGQFTIKHENRSLADVFEEFDDSDDDHDKKKQ